uniref:conjugal transfer protein TrbL family protein n=1 Tax=Ruminococcus flavefaciens TaxID=1265 RepID=UPI0013DBEF0B
MFDWVGDAIDWIGDGISSLWDNTVGVVTSEAARVIFDMMFDWLFMLIYDGIAALFYAIDQSTADLFELGWIQAFVTLFYNIGWILFITGMVVAVFDTAIAYESGQANIKDTCLNVLKGFFACSLFTVVPQRLYSFCVALQNTFAIDLVGAMIQGRTATLTSAGLDALDAFRSDVSLSSLFFIILFGYCTIKVVFANIKRGGILLCQIAVGSLYMFSVPRGYTDGFVNWCKQVIATCLTAFLQTTILFLGLLTCPDHPI